MSKGSGGGGGKGAARKASISGGGTAGANSVLSDDKLLNVMRGLGTGVGRIDLGALRAAMGGSFEQQTQTLLRLQEQGKIVLMKDDAINMKRGPEFERLQRNAIRVGGAASHSQFDGMRHYAYVL